MSSVLYFLYWFLFEVGCTGFAMLFTHPGPSPDAFVSTLKYAVLWGVVAGSGKVCVHVCVCHSAPPPSLLSCS